MQQFKYVRHQQPPERLVDFLCRRFPYQDRAGWVAAVEKGAISIDGELSSPDLILETGMVVGYERPRESEPAVDKTYRILYQDQAIIAVEKSGNLPIAESGRYYRNVLIEILKETLGLEVLHQVHRLDRETSGVLVVAKSPEVATLLGEQFFKGIPQKRYQTVLVGEMPLEEVLVEQPIKKVKPQGPGTVRIRQVVDPEGKTAKTLFRPIKAAGGLTLAEVELFTGRTHQIRVHAEYLGFPVLGDKLYGQTDEQFLKWFKGEEQPNFGEFGPIDRQLLHASRLELNHPLTGDWLTFESDPAPFFGAYPCCKGLVG
ncbi:MAG: RluA family pseudouridine synthase [bacterium]|nr:RluA family pseudouridine synthase [bacterium]